VEAHGPDSGPLVLVARLTRRWNNWLSTSYSCPPQVAVLPKWLSSSSGCPPQVAVPIKRLSPSRGCPHQEAVPIKRLSPSTGHTIRLAIWFNRPFFQQAARLQPYCLEYCNYIHLHLSQNCFRDSILLSKFNIETQRCKAHLSSSFLLSPSESFQHYYCSNSSFRGHCRRKGRTDRQKRRHLYP
jgi:hypothetical protein